LISGTVRMKSKALKRHVSYNFLAPDFNSGVSGPYHVLFQLHGFSDDSHAWINNSNLARYLEEKAYPFLVILPDGGISYWSNVSASERYEDFIVNDLIENIANTFNIRSGKAVIGGLSMGGNGALRLAFRHPDLFASVWSHSAALWDRKTLLEKLAYLKNVEDLDIYEVAEKANKEKLPVIGFDCGRQDFLIEENRRFHQHLLSLQIPHTYKEHTGKHEWGYWDRYIKDALDQHISVLC
jgi:putative tributyrin esterase